MLVVLAVRCFALEDLQRVDWRPERGWYFYEITPAPQNNSAHRLNQHTNNQHEKNNKDNKNNDKNHESNNATENSLPSSRCQHPDTWAVTCGFIDPTRLALSSSATYQFEQQQYHALMQHYALYPNDLTAVYHFQQFNHWVLDQAMTAAYTWQYNLVQHPAVAASPQLPLSQFGERVLRHLEDRSEQQFWRDLAASSFFMLVSRSDDPRCVAQDRLVRVLQRETGITVWDLSIDAGQLPGATRVVHYHSLPAAQRQALASQLALDWLPTLYLYLVPSEHHHAQSVGQWIRITNGLTPLADIKARTLNFVIAYRHAMVQGAAHGQSTTPDFREHHVYPLVNRDKGVMP